VELKEYIINELNHMKRVTTRALDGLSQNEITWRPASGCNSIGLILLHQARFEDGFIQGRIQGKAQVWESAEWYKKMNLPVEDVGAHYTVEQVNCFPVPELKDLLAYADEVRAKTMEYLNGITPEEFDRKINMPRFGDMAIASMFTFIVVHTAEHAGEIAYLRGVQRGMDK
jgi:uncharacterized damage-inducible protein DinB